MKSSAFPIFLLFLASFLVMMAAQREGQQVERFNRYVAPRPSIHEMEVKRGENGPQGVKGPQGEKRPSGIEWDPAPIQPLRYEGPSGSRDYVEPVQPVTVNYGQPNIQPVQPVQVYQVVPAAPFPPTDISVDCTNSNSNCNTNSNAVTLYSGAP